MLGCGVYFFVGQNFWIRRIAGYFKLMPPHEPILGQVEAERGRMHTTLTICGAPGPEMQTCTN